MPAPVLAYENLGLVQGSGWLFRGLDLFIGERDRLALIGRNGAGKTTLLKCLADLIETDEGRRTIQPGTKVVLLEQDPDVAAFATLREFALAGGAPAHEVEAIADQIGVDLDRPAATASGGERRRAAIARALAPSPTCCCSTSRPTISISPGSNGWRSGSAAIPAPSSSISHDRTFLKRLTRSSLWLDRGQLRRAEVGYGGFEAWTEQVYAEEARGGGEARRQAEAGAALAAARRHRAAQAQPGAARQAARDARGAGGDARAGGDGEARAGERRGPHQDGDRGRARGEALSASGRSSGTSRCASSAATGSAWSARTAPARPPC